MKSVIVCLLVVATFVAAEDAVVVPAQPQDDWGTDLDIVDLADRLGFYSYLTAAKETDIIDTLRNTNPITLFIPTNEAFLSLQQSTRDFWAGDYNYYQKLMMSHVLNGSHPAEELTNEVQYATIDGSLVRIDKYNSTTPTPFIDFASARVIQANYKATNGYIHVIEDVILEIANKTILDRVAQRPDLSMFFEGTAIVQELRSKLNSTTVPYTLFVPNNNAINNLKNGTWAKLLNNSSAMAEVLNYHVTAQTYYGNGLMNGDVLPTLNNLANLTVALRNGKLFINTAQVIEGNAAVLNGVFHVVDTVLLPVVI